MQQQLKRATFEAIFGGMAYLAGGCGRSSPPAGNNSFHLRAGVPCASHLPRRLLASMCIGSTVSAFLIGKPRPGWCLESLSAALTIFRSARGPPGSWGVHITYRDSRELPYFLPGIARGRRFAIVPLQAAACRGALSARKGERPLRAGGLRSGPPAKLARNAAAAAAAQKLGLGIAVHGRQPPVPASPHFFSCSQRHLPTF